MASKIIETWQDDQGRNLVKYESGLVKDADTGLVVSPAPHTLITFENSSAHHRARKEQRQKIIRETASAHAGADAYKIHGDMAYIAAMTEQIMNKAMRPGDPKQVEAARFLMREAGDSSEDDAAGNEDTVSQVREIIRDVARLVDQASQLRAPKTLDNGS